MTSVEVFESYKVFIVFVFFVNCKQRSFRKLLEDSLFRDAGVNGRLVNLMT